MCFIKQLLVCLKFGKKNIKQNALHSYSIKHNNNLKIFAI